MAYGYFKVLTRKTASDKILLDKAFNIAKNQKYDGYQHGLAWMVYKFFDKKSALLADKSSSFGALRNENMSNKKLAEELHKPIITSRVLILACTYFRKFREYWLISQN